jgi:hypothetical protein
MNGTWSGPMSQPNGSVTAWTLRMVVRPHGGTFQVVELRCTGAYTDRRHTASQVVGDVLITQDVSGLCARGGTVWMSPTGDGRLRVRWQDVDAPANQAGGILARA